MRLRLDDMVVPNGRVLWISCSEALCYMTGQPTVAWHFQMGVKSV